MAAGVAYASPADVPLFRYGLIMADPAWSFDNFSAKGEAKNAKAQYDCEPIDAIKAHPVGQMASRDCVLWLWATNPMLDRAFEVLAAWGFQFKTAGHWVKRGDSGKLAFGPGYVLRCAGEPFLIGVMGNPVWGAKNIRSVIEGSVIEAPRREHSRKPDEAYAAAEALVPDVRRLDLFSRQPRAGWDRCGNEADKFAEGVPA